MSDDQKTRDAVEAFRALLGLALRLRNQMDERLRPDGLTTQQAALLTAVERLDGPSVTQAAAFLGTSHQNVAQLVTSLERKGMLAVHPDPADGRRRVLRATTVNADYWQARNPADHAAVAEWFSALSDDELRAFRDMTVRLLKAQITRGEGP
ncbi:MarR family winged helix-turn-helix transcriptional regulator [Spirillospora albida]|uniref:MarR family winged helix-turn-helix transcriptional regulator n=1 Tax=Spirillospora albida TaxID=58123 RepID=UPI0009FD8E78|nr:MarR family transcriptional regulator [Spirillospora albida]